MRLNTSHLIIYTNIYTKKADIMIALVSGIVLSYAILSLVHLGVQIYLAQMHHLQIAKKYKDTDGLQSSISVIYPVYNETPEVLTLVMEYAQSCLHIPGLEMEIIFVDDGSPNRDELDPVYKKYQCDKIKVVYQENTGKRGAQYKGLEHVTGEFVITVDSDTLIIPENIPKLIQPLLCDPSIGAVCGEVLAKNSKTNLLTRLLGLRYWTAFNLERAAQSYLKTVLCCSGPFSVYRSSLLLKVKEAYINQVFCGEVCTYGDDRHLTNLILGEGYHVVYQPGATAWTFVPESLGEFIRQQNRWNKSFFREMIWTFKVKDNVHPYVLFDMLVQPLLFLGFTTALSFSLLLLYQTTNLMILVYYLGTLVTMATVRSLYGLFRTKNILYLLFVLYGFLHVFILIPVRFKSVLTLTDNRWGTRGSVSLNTPLDFSLWSAGYFLILALGASCINILAPSIISSGSMHFNGSLVDWIWRMIVPVGYSLVIQILILIALIRFPVVHKFWK